MATMRFQLREHRCASGFVPYVQFLKPSGSVLRTDQTYLTSSRGCGYVFRNFPRTYLHGKKVRVYWQGYASGGSNVFAYLEVLDGHYERASMVDFPDNAWRVSKGSGTQIILSQRSATFPWTTYTSGVLNLSACTEDDVCLFVRLYDYSGVWGYYIDVDYVQILDVLNNVLMEEYFDDSVHMEKLGSYNDYGYISVDPIPTIDKSVDETYTLTENVPPPINILTQKSTSETYTLVEDIPLPVNILRLKQVWELFELNDYYPVRTFVYPYAPSNLIDLAIQYTREAYEEFKGYNFGITEPLTPKAVHGTQYLRLREDLNRGARRACKLIQDPRLRPMGFSILMMALHDVFKGQNVAFTKTTYTETLRKYGIIAP